MKKRGLGRSLSALLEGTKAATSESGATAVAEIEEQTTHDASFMRLSIELLKPGQYQPRRDFEPEALQELAESIRAQGIVQPLLVRRLPGNHFEIIAGERRWRAAQQAGLLEVPVVVKGITDEEALAIGLIENIQRQDLNALEEAEAFQRLIEEFNMTHQEVAETVGRSRVSVSNLLRLLGLPQDVKKLLEHGDIDMGHARALLTLPTHLQSETARTVVSKGLSVRETERLVRQLTQPKKTDAPEADFSNDPDVMRLQQDLSDKLGAGVSIKQGAKGKGKLVIQYNNLDELEGILAHIK